MLTGKNLLCTLTAELAEMGLRGIASALEERYRSPDFPCPGPLSAIPKIVEPEYHQKMDKRLTNRLRSAHLLGCPRI